MPVLENTDRVTPRSALRHRPIGQPDAKEAKAEKKEKQTTEPADSTIAPAIKRASLLREKQTEEGEDVKDVQEWKQADTTDEVGKKTGRSTSTAAPITQPATAPAARRLTKLPRPTKKTGSNRGRTWHTHPLFYLGIGMVIMLVLWGLLSLVVGWWSTTWDDIHYGRPRTFQIDAVVGHNDSPGNPSHFIAVNLKGRIEIIEFPGGDGTKARIYIGPQLYGNGEDLVPVTLSFADVYGNHHPDMILHFQTTQIVFINQNGGFSPGLAGRNPGIPAIHAKTRAVSRSFAYKQGVPIDRVRPVFIPLIYQHYPTSPCRMAKATAAALPGTSSLTKMLLRCRLTVRWLMMSVSATSRSV